MFSQTKQNLNDISVSPSLSIGQYSRPIYKEFNYYDKSFLSLVNSDTPLRQWFQGFNFSDRRNSLVLPRPFSVLAFARQHEFNHQLFIDSPIIFSMLLDFVHVNDLSIQEFLSLVSLKRAELLKCLLSEEMQQEKSALKFLSKIVFKRITTEDLQFLRSFLRSNFHIHFAHHKVVTFSYLRLMSAYPQLLSNKWLAKMDNPVLMSQCSYQINSLLKCTNLDHNDIIFKVINRIDNWTQLIEYKNIFTNIFKLTDQFEYRLQGVHGLSHKDIILITTPWDLYLHGVVQKNCVFDFANQIAAGTYRIYKVTVTGLSTLGVSVTKEGYVELDQLATANNQHVDSVTNDTVLDWLDLYNNGIAFSRGHKQSIYSVSIKNRHHNNLIVIPF